MAEVAKCSTC